MLSVLELAWLAGWLELRAKELEERWLGYRTPQCAYWRPCAGKRPRKGAELQHRCQRLEGHPGGAGPGIGAAEHIYWPCRECNAC